MWGLLLNLLIVCFVGEERENQRKGFFARLKSRFMTFVNGVIILAFIVLSLGTIYVTFKIVTI